MLPMFTVTEITTTFLGMACASMLYLLYDKVQPERFKYSSANTKQCGSRGKERKDSGHAIGPLIRESSKSVQSDNLPAAHRVLYCYDLLLEIIYSLYDEHVDTLGEIRPTLAALARVCKTISPVALDVLWKDLDDVQPLALLLDSTGALRLPHEPFLSLGAKFFSYSHRVRSIVFDPDSIPPDALRMMEKLEPPFTKLTSLHWIIPTSTPLTQLLPFVPPSLVNLTITNKTNPQKTKPQTDRVHNSFSSFPKVLSIIRNKARSLSSLGVFWFSLPVLSADICSDVLRAISSFTQLTELCISFAIVASPEVLSKLSGLHHLRILDISHDREVDYERFSFHPVFTGFDALSVLRLDGPYPIVHGLLCALPSCAVQDCTVSLQDSCSNRLQQAVVESVTHKFGRSIHNLELVFPGDAELFNTGTYNPLFIAAIPYLQTMQLVDVALSWLDSSLMTDGLCHNMSIAWPHLRTLRLMSATVVIDPPATMVTLAGLRSFANNCPNLLSISIQLNGSGDHWANEIQADSHTVAVKLSELYLATSLITSPTSVATFLRWCFPALRVVRFNNVQARMRGEKERIAAWDELRAMLNSRR